jgi:hypothetical protein
VGATRNILAFFRRDRKKHSPGFKSLGVFIIGSVF